MIGRGSIDETVNTVYRKYRAFYFLLLTNERLQRFVNGKNATMKIGNKISKVICFQFSHQNYQLDKHYNNYKL